MVKNWINNAAAPKLALAGILVAALALRVWGITFGLPYIYHVDEHFYVATALKLGAGILNNSPYNPTGLSNILFLEYAAYYALGKAMGVFASPVAFEAAYRSDPTVIYLLARLTTAGFGAATTLALYLLGKAAHSPKTGLIAAGLLAVSFLHVRDSHYAVPDIAIAFFVALAVALAASGLRHRRRRDIYLAGLAGGLALAMKWTGFPVAVPVLLAAAWVEHKEHKGLVRKLANRTVVAAVLALAIGFALGSPQILINPAPYARTALGIYQSANSNVGGMGVSDAFDKWLFHGKTLLYGVGIVLLALGIVGALHRVLLAVKSRDMLSVLLLSFPLIYFPFIATAGYRFARYLLPLVPFLALFAAEAIVLVWAAIGPRARPGWRLAALMLVVTIAQPVAQSVRHNWLLTREDTRTLARQWIEATIPEGSKIAVDWEVHGPPLSTPGDIMPYSHKVFDVHIIGNGGLSDHPQDWYKEQGFDYLITSSFFYNVWPESMYPARAAFYASLDEQFTLLQEFRPYQGDTEPPFVFDEMYGPAVSLWQRERPGPTLKIYKVESQGNAQVP